MRDRELRDYLEAKTSVDRGCFNPTVHRCFRSRLAQMVSPKVLDVGTGTGAMLRRLLGFGLGGAPSFLGVDRNNSLLPHALKGCAAHLRRRGLKVDLEEFRLRAYPHETAITVEIRELDILQAPSCFAAERFDAITAHTVMDLLPLDPAVRAIWKLLRGGGLFYATMTYDGTTTFLPPYRDGRFEEVLLEAYDASMESRRYDGLSTGGAKAGRRLVGQLSCCGFMLLDCGTSDWQLFPRRGTYRRSERVFLGAILNMIYEECSHRPDIDANRLRAWHVDRYAALHENRLGFTAHQLDMCAQKPAAKQLAVGSSEKSDGLFVGGSSSIN